MAGRNPLMIVAVALIAVAMQVADLETSDGAGLFSTSPALADDGDDGGDDGGRGARGRSFGGADRFSPRRTGRARRAQAVQIAHMPDQVIVRGLAADDLERLVAAGYVTLRAHQSRSLGGTVTKLKIPAGTGLEEAVALISGLGAAIVADFNHLYRPQGEDCRGLLCPSLRLIGWPAAAGGCEARPVIGMIDTGINVDHPALRGQDVEVLALDREGRRESGTRHGTSVAALLVGSPASRAPGLLPDARLIAVDGFHSQGRSDVRMEAFDLVEALDLLAEWDVQVINLSFAGPHNSLVEASVNALIEEGIDIVAAAGNGGPRAAPLYPAGYEKVVAVTAVDSRRRVYRRAVQGEHIDLAAPGVKVWTAASQRGRTPRTGTSFAVPFVTAALAIARFDPQARRAGGAVDLLARTALDLGEPGRDKVFGWGLLQTETLCKGPVDEPSG